MLRHRHQCGQGDTIPVTSAPSRSAKHALVGWRGHEAAPHPVSRPARKEVVCRLRGRSACLSRTDQSSSVTDCGDGHRTWCSCNSMECVFAPKSAGPHSGNRSTSSTAARLCVASTLSFAPRLRLSGSSDTARHQSMPLEWDLERDPYRCVPAYLRSCVAASGSKKRGYFLQDGCRTNEKGHPMKVA
jgi:hypothetical protein